MFGIEHLPIIGGLISFILMLMVMFAFAVGVGVIVWVIKRKGKVADGIDLSDGVDAKEWAQIQKLVVAHKDAETLTATKDRLRDIAGKDATKAA